MEGVTSKNQVSLLDQKPGCLYHSSREKTESRIRKSRKTRRVEGFGKRTKFRTEMYKKNDKPDRLLLQLQDAAEGVLSLMQSKPSPKNPTTKEYKRAPILPYSLFQQLWVFFRHRATQSKVITLFLLCHLCFTPSSLSLFSVSALKKKLLLPNSQPLVTEEALHEPSHKHAYRRASLI